MNLYPSVSKATLQIEIRFAEDHAEIRDAEEKTYHCRISLLFYKNET